MKTFLVPVDFSDNSFRALEYAIELAGKAGSKVVVSHMYEMPSVLPGFTATLLERSKAEAEEKLEKFLLKLSKSDVPVESFVREGDVVGQISRVIEEYNVSLVVMGTGGGKNLVKKVFGTTSAAIAKRGLCPVLIIPENAVIRPLENIVYAADFENGDEVTMLQLMQLKEVFNASLTFLHIKNNRQPDYIDNEYIKENLLKQFPQSGVKFVEIENKNVAEGISVYVQANNASLLAFTMLNRHLIEKVMHTSVTKQLLRNLNLPMLALPENGILLDIQPEKADEVQVN